MPAYRSFGGLDDNILTDGDPGFVGMNQRLQPNQLQAGEVVLSKNGRMDGYWQPRKGIALRSGALASSGSPLRLPFFLINSNKVISSAASSSNVVTLTFTLPHGLTGTAYATLGNVQVTTEPITGIKAGSYQMTVASATTLTFSYTIADNPTLTVNGTYGYINSQIDDDAVTSILGSCLFSDPTSNNDESIILATGLVAKKVNLGTYSVANIPYPSGSIVSGEVNMIQAFDKVYLFRSGKNQAWEWIPQGRPIEAAERLTSGFPFPVTITIKAHGLTAGDQIYISGLTGTYAPSDGFYTVASVTSADVFVFNAAPGGGTGALGVTNAVMKASGFTKVIGGTYTQPQTFSIQAKDVDVVSGLVTATVTGNTTIKAGDFVTIYETTTSGLASMEGKSFQVISANATTITWYAPVGDYNTSSSDVFEFGGRFSVGGGFTHMPAPPWGSYFQRRLWVPFWYDVGGTAASPTYTDRVERDQILASDILDGDTYDQIFSQFRITAGIADFTVGFHSFYDDNLIVFNRNSIHLVKGTQGSLEDTVVTELTSEVGCLARKSIVGFANQVFFLSDNGVYAVEFLNDYNLRGTGEPLSKSIQPFIDRINKSLADNAVAAFYDNRYYIAVPLDSEVGANDANGNNTVLIFNTLNKAWESVDTFANGQFNIINMHYGKVGARNSLFYVNDQGGIHEANANDTPIDSASLDPLGGSTAYNVLYELQTRGYTLGTYDRKRFSVAQVQCQANDQNTDAVFQFSTEDPDADKYQIGQINTLIGQDLPPNETASLRMRIGNTRGFYGQLTILPNLSGSQGIGRPKINSISVDATVTNRQTISQF
jgi:hypothetical protein